MNERVTVEYLDYRPRMNGGVDYKYRVSGGHDGKPVDLYVNDVRQDLDEDGYLFLDYRSITHAYDANYLFSQEFLDTYTNVLKDDITEALRYR